MTAETDLLPLHYDELPEIPEDIVMRMQIYARANVAHAIAPLQAEIEALRAEVETLRDGLDYLRQMQGAPDVLELRAKAARAERLAEALRLIQSAKDRGLGIDYARGLAQSTLRDYDPEGGNG